MVYPEKFAGFIALNGNLKTNDPIGNYNVFPGNANHKPVYIINTKEDILYPINQIQSMVTYLKNYNDNSIYRELESYH